MIVAIDTVIHYLADINLVDSQRDVLKLWAESIVDECASVCIADDAIREDVLRIKESIL